MSPDQARILQGAASRGAFIVASAGNFPENREVFPAAHPAVFAVAGLNVGDQKMADSNYGTFVDLSAPGENIRAAGPEADDAYLTKTGTSQAAAAVAAAAALVKLRHPEFTARDLKVALKSSADQIVTEDLLFLARLGSGRLNVAAAMEAALLTEETPRQTKPNLPQGYLRYATADGRPAAWELSHFGEFKGTQFTLESLKGTPGSSALAFLPRRRDGSLDPTGRSTLQLSEIQGPIFIPGPPPLVMFLPDDQAADLQWLMDYRLDPVHLPTRFCEGTRELDAEGEFEDGSGPDDYAPQSNCFWLIKAPPGKVTRFEFLEFDTEARHDFLYFFEGRATNEKILAIFSGSALPPEVTSGSPETLVWFVTDSQNQGQGWRVRFHFVDVEASPPPTENSSP